MASARAPKIHLPSSPPELPQMKLYTFSLVAGIAGAFVAAWSLGGTQGAGALVGALLGLGISAVAVMKQRHALLTNPRQAMNIFVLASLLKLVVVGVGGALLRYVEVLAVRADWMSFLIAFPIAVLWLTSLGAVANMKVLEHRTT